ncbi:MAG: IS481 family transposase [Nitrospirota bacterium]|jgi:transposase InsO family protein|nr:IS481 family transposase [Nitrospirota bacterium]
METNPKKQRQHFYRDYASGQWSMSELCDRYQISRPTGYKWVDRIEAEGLKAVDDRSRAPNRHPNRTPEHVEQEILLLREKYGWGATKLRQILKRRHPSRSLPARSTVNEILDRHGHLRKNRRRQSWKHPGAVRLETAGPNEIWPADFKGQFKTGDGKYCFPLTVTDHYSRMLLLCKALRSVRTEGAKPAFRTLFREYGLPDAIRTDNGPPFASTGIHGLCELNVWWMKLGIVHQRIRPASPQENGQHERMHKDMKREAASPPAANLAKQQRKLNLFQQRYNHERPHEALSGDFPAERWQPSRRAYPSRLPQPDYPGHFEVRRVSSCGTFRLSGQRFLNNALAGENIGLEEVGDDLWNIVYYTTVLGRIDRQTGKITGSDNV